MRQRKQLKLKYQAQQWKHRKQWKITKKKSPKSVKKMNLC